MVTNAVKITDLTLRDGHQSLLATRMRTEDMLHIAPKMDKAGFYAMEVWGGATFDVPTRFLNEDPWERLSALKKVLPNTPLQMLLRGQNLVGYRNYADDVVEAFVKHAAEQGIDIFRVFDALNDERNFETALKAIKASGKHAQLSISFSLTGRKIGGDIYSIDYYISKAKKMEEMGADSLCIKDMAGLISPNDAYNLIRALKENINIPINLHSHYTSGMASMSLLKAIEAGVDIIDTVLAPFGLRSSHPAIEPFVVALQDTDRDTGLNLAQLAELGEYFEEIAPKYREFMNNTKMSVIDTGVLKHQVPGGMISNLVSQLKEAEALDRINEVYKEIPRVRKDMGYPPLVTPTSQIVGIQAVQNVLFGRYKVVSSQVKDYMYGLYGQPPGEIDEGVRKKVLKGYERGETPIMVRPADVLEPELEKAKKESKDIAKNMGDTLIYALYPTTGMRFLRWKYGLEEAPPETKGKTIEDIKKEDGIVAKAKSGKLAENRENMNGGYKNYRVYVGGSVFNIGLEEVDEDDQNVPQPVAAHGKQNQEKTPPATIMSEGETPIMAPMPGVVIKYEVSEGDEVKDGDNILVLEAMKMAIDLPSPVAGKVKVLNFKNGDHVSRNDVLAIIA